jgi:hypothetical protein
MPPVRHGAGEYLEPARLGCSKANGAGVKGVRTVKPSSETRAGATRYTGFDPSGIGKGHVSFYGHNPSVVNPYHSRER